MCKHIRVENNQPLIEDITREFNRGMWTIGYTGQSPERLKTHQQNWHTFHKTTLAAEGGPAHGDTYGMPWPCWGTPEMKHPGTHILYDTSKTVAEGGGNFRTRFGVEFEGKSLLAEDSYSKGCELQDGYPEFSDKLLKQLGWWDDLTAEEKAAAEGKNWKTDLSGGIQRVAIKHGCIPFGNAKARAIVWTFPDRVPLHREPLYTPRRNISLITRRGTIKRLFSVCQPCTNRFKRKINQWNTRLFSLQVAWSSMKAVVKKPALTLG